LLFDPEDQNSQPGLFARTSCSPLPEDAAIREANRVAAEKQKEKDDKKKKQRRRRARLDRGKRRQGSDKEDEEEEEEGAYGSASLIPWEDLADEDVPAGGDASLGGPFPFHVGEDTPSEPMETGRAAPSGPSEQRDGSKRQCADEAQPGRAGWSQNVAVRWRRGESGNFFASSF
jgi:hypothetical protein